MMHGTNMKIAYDHFLAENNLYPHHTRNRCNLPPNTPPPLPFLSRPSSPEGFKKTPIQINQDR